MTKYQFLMVLFLASTLISIGYIVVKCIKKQQAQGFVIGALMLIMPVIGPVLMFFSYIWAEILKKFKTAYLDPAELSFSKEKKKIILGDDLQRGINKVPLEEALLEADNENARRVLLDILKSDFESSIPILIKAIDSEDSEVSHYASAAISDVLSKFKKNQKKMDEQYKENPEDEEILNDYMKYVYSYLTYGVFPETELNSYLEVYEGLMQSKYNGFNESITAECMKNWIIMLVKENRQELARNWMNRLEKMYPEVLETYKARLQYSYRYDREDFINCIREIKQSTVDLDDETVEFVRFFQV